MSRLLKTTPLGDLVFSKRTLIQVEPKETLENALHLMQESNITCIPVYNSLKGQYLGMIDVWDIMSMFAFCSFFTNKIEHPKVEDLEEFKFGKATVSDVLDLSERTRYLNIFEPSAPLQTAIRTMTESGAHRVLVSQKDDQTGRHCYRLLSRTDIIKFLNGKLCQLK